MIIVVLMGSATATIVALAGYLIDNLPMISPEYETEPAQFRFAY